MKKLSLVVVTATMLPLASLAQDQNIYHCSQGDLQRRVEIVYETGVTVTCEVHYYKDTEAPGERQVLWRAVSQEGYCEEKTRVNDKIRVVLDLEKQMVTFYRNGTEVGSINNVSPGSYCLFVSSHTTDSVEMCAVEE